MKWDTIETCAAVTAYTIVAVCALSLVVLFSVLIGKLMWLGIVGGLQ